MYSVLSAFSSLMFVISVIALIRPLPSIKLPTRKRALLTLVATFIFIIILGEFKPPPTPEELARIEKLEQEKKQTGIERERQEQERKKRIKRERIAREQKRVKERIEREKERVARTQPSGITFQEVNSKFGINSSLTDLQKREEWKKYKGKCVQWTGELAHLDEGMLGGIVVGFKHLSDTFTYDVYVTASSQMKDHLLTLSQGSWHEYKGRLKDYGAFLGIHLEWGCY